MFSGGNTDDSMMAPNKQDAADPAMTLWLTIEDQRHRAADLEH